MKKIQAVIFLFCFGDIIFCLGQTLEVSSKPGLYVVSLQQQQGNNKLSLPDCYFDLKISKRDSLISGRYYYYRKTINNKPQYILFRGKLLVNDSIVLTEYDKQGKAIATIELKKTIYNDFEEWYLGRWKSIDGKSSFLINAKSTREFKNKLLFSTQNDTLVYKINSGLNRVTYNVYLNTHKNNRHYLIFEYRYLEKGNCYDRGQCGCGEAARLVYLELSNELNIIKKREFESESCLKNIQTYYSLLESQIIMKIIKLVSASSDVGIWEKTKLVFNLKKPETGLIVDKITKE